MDLRTVLRGVAIWAACCAGAAGVGCQGEGSDERARDGVSGVDTVATATEAGAGDVGGGTDQGADTGDPSEVDATIVGGATGTPCGAGDECASGWCVPSALGTVCVDLCATACPSGYRCIPASGEATDPIFVCVATTPNPTGADVVEGGDADTTITDGAGTGLSDDAGAIADGADGSEGADGTSETTVTPDADGDGIPDDIDNLPCLAVMLIVYNSHVTSASLSFNGSEIVPASEFPTTAGITRYLNVVEGENNLAVGGKLTGSPGDSLTLIVSDTQGHVYFETVIVRASGSPQEHSYHFTIDAHCD